MGKSASPQVTSQTNTIDPTLAAYRNWALENAKNTSSTGYNKWQGAAGADASDPMNAAGAGYAGAAGALPGAQGAFAGAAGMLPGAADALRTAGAGIGGLGFGAASSGIDAATRAMGGAPNVGGFMSPYMHNVVDATNAQYDESGARAQNDVNSNATLSGALGGDRHAVAAGAAAAGNSRDRMSSISNLLNGGYQTAMGQAQTDKGMNMQGGISLGGLGFGGVGQGMGASSTLGGWGMGGAGGLASIGSNGLSGLMNYGQNLTGLEQNKLSFLQGQDQTSQNWQRSGAMDYLRSMGGLPGSSTQTTSRSQTSNWGNTLGGLATLGGSLFGGPLGGMLGGAFGKMFGGGGGSGNDDGWGG